MLRANVRAVASSRSRSSRVTSLMEMKCRCGGGADDRLRVARRAAAADLDVVAIEGDVDGAERGRLAGPLLDQAPEPLRERDTAGLDPDERHAAEVGVRLDDLVGDPGERPAER